MKFQSISIVPETVGCNARCKYCIADMTPEHRTKKKINFNKLSNALQYAISGGAQTAILTSKGETTLSDWKYLGKILESFKSHGFGQRDLHSNLIVVPERGEEFRRELVEPAYGLTNVTMTLASFDYDRNKELMGLMKDVDYASLFRFLREDCNLSIRLSCVMNKKGVHDRETIEEYIDAARDNGIDNVVFRGLWIPQYMNSSARVKKTLEWCTENQVGMEVADSAVQEMVTEGKASYMFSLPWGAAAYQVNGVGVTGATCTQNSYEDCIKSLVYLPDNHVYPDWEHSVRLL